MKKWLPNLLLVWAVILCALIAVQWFREARLRGELQYQHDQVVDRDKKLEEVQGRLKLLESEIKRLDGVKVNLTEDSKKASQEVTTLRRSLAEVEEKLRREVRAGAVYKEVLDQANESIRRQNADIERQNEEVKKTNEAIKKQNEIVLQQNREIEKLAKERNDMVEQYNKLVKDYEAVVKGPEEATDPKAKK